MHKWFSWTFEECPTAYRTEMPSLILCTIWLLGLNLRITAAPVLNAGSSPVDSTTDVLEQVSQALIASEGSLGPTEGRGYVKRHRSLFRTDDTRELIGDFSFATSTIDISLPESIEKDVSDGIDVYNRRISLGNQKRAPPRAIYSCPPLYLAVRSVCNRNISPQAYITQCIKIGSVIFVDQVRVGGNCARHEICIDGVEHPHPAPGELVETAYCVSAQNFVRIAQDQRAHLTPSSTTNAVFTAQYHPGSGRHIVEAVMTGLDARQSVFASTLRIEAQSFIMASSGPVWRCLLGGLFECSNCSSMGFFPVPDGTQRIQVAVTLPAMVAGGLLYLASVAL